MPHYRPVPLLPTPPTSLPATEQRHPASLGLDELSSLELVTLFNRENLVVLEAVQAVLPRVAAAIERIATVLAGGGRWFLSGAGTSGRLAVLEALEMGPTFNLPPGQVIALLAGGPRAAYTTVEDVEDSADLGAADLRSHEFGPGDILLGLAASGRTPYVLGALGYARSLGAPTVAIANNPGSPLAALAELAIEPATGPELLTGSTRLKAGTAQKLVLNMLSTGVMVRLGKVYSNLMVDVQPTNAKLRERAVRIVAAAGGLAPAAAQALLEATGWEVKPAVVMALAEAAMAADATAARRCLAAARGHVRRAAMGE